MTISDACLKLVCHNHMTPYVHLSDHPQPFYLHWGSRLFCILQYTFKLTVLHCPTAGDGGKHQVW